MQTSKIPVVLATAVAVIGAALCDRAAAQDPLKIDPDIYTLALENEKVRVFTVTFKPGAKIGRHSHPDHVVYVIKPGKLKISRSETDSKDYELKTGESMFIPAETHWAENVGDTEIQLVVVELKGSGVTAEKE